MEKDEKDGGEVTGEDASAPPTDAGSAIVVHDFQTIIETILPKPRIFISLAALLDMQYLVSGCGGYEISWLGTARKVGRNYHIDEVFLFEQDVTSGSTELSPADIAKVATELIQRGEMDKVNNLKFWGHVHPGESTYPSKQDNDQMEIFSNGNPWFLRGIFSTSGRAEFTLVDYERDILIKDVEWAPLLELDFGRQAELREEIQRKVKRAAVAYVYSGYTVGNRRVTRKGKKRSFGGAHVLADSLLAHFTGEEPVGAEE